MTHLPLFIILYFYSSETFTLKTLRVKLTLSLPPILKILYDYNIFGPIICREIRCKNAV